MADPNLPVEPPVGLDWAVVKSGDHRTVAVLLLVVAGQRVDDWGFSLDEAGDHLPHPREREGQVAEMSLRSWGHVRRASKKVVQMIEQQARNDATFAVERQRIFGR